MDRVRRLFGSSSSSSSYKAATEDELNLAEQLKPSGTPPASNFVVDETDENRYHTDENITTPIIGHANLADSTGRGTNNVRLTAPRTSVWVILFLFVVFCILSVTTGIRCSLEPTCRVHYVLSGPNVTLTTVPGSTFPPVVLSVMQRFPTVGVLVTNPATSTLAVTALNVLVTIQFLLTVNISIMVKTYTIVTFLGMSIACIGIYVTLYLALILPEWFMAICPLAGIVLWGLFALYGLRKFYHDFRSKLPLKLSLFSLSGYTVSFVLYVAFSAVSYEQVPLKDVAVFSCELGMLLFCLFFVLTMVFHSRRVSYRIQVKEGYTVI